MNEKSSSGNSGQKTIFYGNHQKILILGALALLLTYTFARPQLERWLGMELPVLVKLGNEPTDYTKKRPATPLRNQGNRETRGKDSATKDANLEGDPSTLPLPPGETTEPPGSDSSSSAGNSDTRSSKAEPEKPASPRSNSKKFEFEELPGGELRSPAGLIYGMGPNREHRVDHVMLHAKDIPDRIVHSVFEGDRDTILRLIDEAYTLIKQNSKRVRKFPVKDDPDRTEYVIDMKRPIGYRGGMEGLRDRHPRLTRLKLILANENRVITAFPY